MNPIINCPKCAANVAPLDFVCDYCGYVFFERVKNMDGLQSNKASFDEGMEIIKDNMNALYDIPKPSAGKTVKSGIRLILALFTFGIVLIFWHKPKKRFVKENYDKLKSVIERNISFLKISSSGSNDLIARIKVLEDELIKIDKQVKSALFTKTVTTIIIVVLYVGWFVYIANKEPIKHATYTVTPFDTIIHGNLKENITISDDTVKIIHTPAGSYEEWELSIKLKTKKLQNVRKNIKFNCTLILTDQNGVSVLGFNEAELDNPSMKNLILNMENASSKEGYYKFLLKNDLNYTQYRDTIPVEAVKFLIQIDSIH